SICSLYLRDALPISLSSPSGAPRQLAFSGGTMQLEVADRFRVSSLHGHFDSYRQSESQTEEVITLSEIDIEAQTSQLAGGKGLRSEEHTSELQTRFD